MSEVNPFPLLKKLHFSKTSKQTSNALVTIWMDGGSGRGLYLGKLKFQKGSVFICNTFLNSFMLCFIIKTHYLNDI